MAGKTIEITNNPENGTTSVMVEQRPIDVEETGVEISPSGGISLETGLGWGVDVAVVLVAVAVLYIGKKFVDKWFSKES